MVAVLTAGGSNVYRAIEVFVNDWVVGQATDQIMEAITEYTGMSADEVAGRNIGFKYYFPGAEANGFAQLYATFEIDPFDERCFEENETVSGVVRDAETNNPIEDVLVQMDGTLYSNNTYTNYAGEYEFITVPSGDYDMVFTKSGYITEYREISVEQGSPVVVNVVMSEQLGTDEYRIVLTWGTTPPDLDSHLWTNGYHVFWANRGSLTSLPYAYLDIDDVNGEGPETITISQLLDDCVYAVYNYTGSPSLTESNAEVNIYDDNGLLQSFDVPTSGEGRWWYVCDISESGNVIPRDFLTSDSPGSINGLPTTEPLPLKPYNLKQPSKRAQ